MAKIPKMNEPTPKIREDFGGGLNAYLGVRQIKDNEAVQAINCDFKGKGGIGNRAGYDEVDSVGATYTQGIYGMAEYHTSSKDQLIKFASDGTNVVLNHSTDGSAWTAVTGTKFTDNLNIDVVQAASVAYSATPPIPVDAFDTNGTLFSFNGTDQMVKYDGSTWAAHTGATKGFYGEFYNNRLWCVDDTHLDTLNFSTSSPDATKPLDFVSDGTSTKPGTITFLPGSGVEITGLKRWKNSLYVFLRDAIYKVDASSTANTFTVTLITNSIGCVSHRSIAHVGEDLFFAGDDGVYSLGEVANYTSVRTTNKSAKIQKVFDNLSSANKTKLVGIYHNFKYHLFYSLFGSTNDSCVVYDVRYSGWMDWRNMSCNGATLYRDSTNQTDMYFGNETNGEVYKMYSGTTDNGALISTTFDTKSFDEGMADRIKLYFDHTFTFGAMNGSVTISVIFDDTSVSLSKSISNVTPQGGLGRDALGVKVLGGGTNTVTVTNYRGVPLRIKAKGQKFAVQYRITSSGDWRLDSISTLMDTLSHYKFPSYLKLN